MSTSETRLVLVGIVVVALIGLAALARWHRNRRLNARDEHAGQMLLLRSADLDRTMLGGTDAYGNEYLVAGSSSPVQGIEGSGGEPREDQLDDEWADQLHQMNTEHLNLIDHLERVHPAEPCQEWCCWERRLEAQRAAWLELVRADVTVVAEWIVAGTPGRWVPSAAGWPSDDWRGEMIPA